ncbi:C-C chemokine receptor type 1-like [Dreissena polymorpha]|nr:C-C chemokine receptor type 1-like [Dreissena polymorpha]
MSMEDHAKEFNLHFKHLFFNKENDTSEARGLNSWLCSYDVKNGSNVPNLSAGCPMFHDNMRQFLLDDSTPYTPSPEHRFFTYVTPVIAVFGVVGNSVSLMVFLSKNMRKLSASMYLIALAISDIMSILLYVLPEWLKHGEPLLSGYSWPPLLQQNGVCKSVLYIQYIARFLSSWFVVFFTIERFIGVCFPLRRKDLCDPRSAARVILGAVVVASAGCVFKPVLSGSFPTISGAMLCTSDKEHQYLSFILDSIFGVIITFIPFILITVLNVFIIRRLVVRNKRSRQIRVVTTESIIRLEFTFILLAMSICFVALNLPYFAVWCKRYWKIRQMFNLHMMSPTTLQNHANHISDLDDTLHVTRTILYTNYCINFCLYSVTGAYFRKELKHLFCKRDKNIRLSYAHRCSAYNTRAHSMASPQTSLL